MQRILLKVFDNVSSSAEIKCLIERPMINSMRFQASLSAIRCLEATLIILEQLRIPYEYIDSKEWQSKMLPKGIWKKGKKGKMKADQKELKSASFDIGKRLYPSVVTEDMKDCDSILICEYLMRYKK